MLADCEVRDLPEGDTELFSEVTPLREVAELVRSRKLEMVLVAEGHSLRGVVRGDTVLRLATRLPDAPIGMLPTQHVIIVPPATTLLDAVRTVTSYDVAGVAVESLGTWSVLTREQLVSWSRAHAKSSR